MTSWRTMITEEMTNQGETWNDVVACTLTEKELDRKFDNDYGAANREAPGFQPWGVVTDGHGEPQKALDEED